MRKENINNLVTESQYNDIISNDKQADNNHSNESEIKSKISKISTQQSVDGVYKMSIDDSGQLLEMMKEGKRISNGTILNFIKVTFPEVWNNNKGKDRGNLVDDIIDVLKKKGASQTYSISDEFITVFIDRLVGSREDLIKALKAIDLVEEAKKEMEYTEPSDNEVDCDNDNHQDQDEIQEQTESE